MTAQALRMPFAFVPTACELMRDDHIAERAMDLNEVPPLAPYVDLPRLAELAQQLVKRALDAFVSADPAKAETILQADDHVDALFLKIFNELLTFMMEDARNIRRATALMFVAKHLERIGDHATNVAEMVVYMVRGTDIRHPRSRQMATPGV